MPAAVSSQIAGRIAYRSAEGAALGEERFELSEYAGGRSLRAVCEFNDIGLLRDVSVALDSHWRPVDAFSRITQSGRVLASSWFGVGRDTVRVESMIHSAGRVTQEFNHDPPITYLGLHPLQGDALVTTQAAARPVGHYAPVHAVTNSTAENGDRGLYATRVCIDVAYLGEDTVTVAAGRFPARKFGLRWHPDRPPAHLWVRQADCVFLKLTWSQISNWYELVALRERDTEPARSASTLTDS